MKTAGSKKGDIEEVRVLLSNFKNAEPVGGSEGGIFSLKEKI